MLQKLQAQRKKPFKHVLNEVLRRGLLEEETGPAPREHYSTPVLDAGSPRYADLDRTPRSRLVTGGISNRNASLGDDRLAQSGRRVGHRQAHPLCWKRPQRTLYAADQANGEGVESLAQRAATAGLASVASVIGILPGWNALAH